MNVITAVDYDPYKYFVQMAQKHKHNWHAIFFVPNKRAKTAAMRTLFNMLEDSGLLTTMHGNQGWVTVKDGATARFHVAFKGITDNLAGNEYQQIDGTEFLTKYDEDKVRELLRTRISIPLAKDMAIR